MTGTIKFHTVAGALVRRAFVANIKNYCFQRNLEIKIEEDKGFLDSNFRVAITGPKDAIIKAEPELKAWLEKR